MGVIVEIVVTRAAFNIPPAAEDDEAFEVSKGVRSKEWVGLYCKAELPAQQFQDLEGMAIEKQNAWCTNPIQLMKCIPELVPIANKALRPRKEEGAFTLAAEADQIMREANWDELLNMQSRMVEEDRATAPSGSSAPP